MFPRRYVHRPTQWFEAGSPISPRFSTCKPSRPNPRMHSLSGLLLTCLDWSIDGHRSRAQRPRVLQLPPAGLSHQLPGLTRFTSPGPAQPYLRDRPRETTASVAEKSFCGTPAPRRAKVHEIPFTSCLRSASSFRPQPGKMHVSDTNGAERMAETQPIIDPELLEILACPACHGELVPANDRLICRTCQRRYPIEDGIPILLVEEAELPEKPGT